MKKLLIITLMLASVQLGAQDLPYYKRIVKELSSAKYQGRGYARGGANKAGKYLEAEFRKAGADEVVCQPFAIDINTFCGAMEMRADGRKLRPGVDFSMREYSPGVHGEFPVYHVDTLNFDGDRLLEELARPENAGCMVCCDFWFTYKHRKVFSKLQKAGACPNAGLLYTWEAPIKFFKAYGEKVVDKPIVWVTPEAISGVKRVKLDVDNEFLEGYGLFNVIAKVEGIRHDSCYVFTAHYDHLGNLGRNVYYPGANDNASGTAAIVTLAKHYAQNRPEFDMYFAAFSGEDANLRGSTFFAEHPPVPLERIKFLFNIDMIGDDNPVQYCEVSDAGMPQYPRFEKVNSELGLFEALNRGPLAANSDHYPFAVRDVPCIFLENQEGSAFPHYHTPADNIKTVRWDSYEPVFKLITGFIDNAMKETVFDVIMSRKSVRSYTDQPVTPEQIETMLKAAMAAPSGMNVQPWRFVVVTNKETKEKLAVGFNKMIAKAPVAIVICGKTTKAIGGENRNWTADCAAATENLLLAAEALGLGAVWTACYPYDDRMGPAIEALGLPEDVLPYCIVPVGYQAGNEKPKDKWKPENVHYEKW